MGSTWSNEQNELLTAVTTGTMEYIQMCVQNSPTLETTNLSISPLVGAIIRGDLEIVKFLVLSGADLNTPCPRIRQTIEIGLNFVIYAQSEWTPLLWAVYLGHRDIVEYLLQQGADVNSRTSVES